MPGPGVHDNLMGETEIELPICKNEIYMEPPHKQLHHQRDRAERKADNQKEATPFEEMRPPFTHPEPRDKNNQKLEVAVVHQQFTTYCPTKFVTAGEKVGRSVR